MLSHCGCILLESIYSTFWVKVLFTLSKFYSPTWVTVGASFYSAFWVKILRDFLQCICFMMATTPQFIGDVLEMSFCIIMKNLLMNTRQTFTVRNWLIYWVFNLFGKQILSAICGELIALRLNFQWGACFTIMVYYK